MAENSWTAGWMGPAAWPGGERRIANGGLARRASSSACSGNQTGVGIDLPPDRVDDAVAGAEAAAALTV